MTDEINTPATDVVEGTAAPADTTEAPVTSEPAVAAEEAVPAEETIVAVEEPAAPAPAPAEPAQVSAEQTQEERAAQTNNDYAASFPSLHEGDVVKGVVVHIDRDGVLVDVGTKSEGLIRLNELTRDSSVSPEEIVTVGETIDVYVLEAETQDGNLLLSKKRADFEQSWVRIKEAQEQDKTLTAMVTDRVKGGLVVDLGIRGFVPASHVGNGSLKNNLDRFVGQEIRLKVIEVDKERHKVVLSNKMCLEEERVARKHETMSTLQVGQTRKGVVRRITNYGAFVDLGGIDGLLHISEMSWSRINHPSEVLKEGEEIDVVVLKMDLEAGRVSLGLRQILPDPWAGIENRYHVGEMIVGQVTRLVPFGAFVQVEPAIEGIIPNSELGKRGQKAVGLLTEGQEVEVKVIDVRPEERKMTLSLRQAKQEEEVRHERKQVEEFHARPEREEHRFTIGDALRAKEEAEAEADAEAEQE